MTLGDVIKKYRTEHNMSMDAFAQLSGLSKAYVSILERNVNPTTNRPVVPSIVTFKCVSDAIGISLNELLETVDENQPVIIVSTPEPSSKRRGLLARSKEFHSDKGTRLSCKIDSVLYDDLARFADKNNRTIEDEIEERLYWSVQNELDELDSQF